MNRLHASFSIQGDVMKKNDQPVSPLFALRTYTKPMTPEELLEAGTALNEARWLEDAGISPETSPDHAVVYRLGEKARQQFIETNLALAARFARHWGRIDFDDAFQLAISGMMRALATYDVRLGFKFNTYAGHWMFQKLSRFDWLNHLPVHVPIHVQDQMRKEKKSPGVVRQLKQEKRSKGGGKKRAPKEVSDSEYYQTLRFSAVDQRVGDEGEARTVGEMLPDPNTPTDEDMEVQIDLAWVRKAVETIKDARERFVITHRFGLEGQEAKSLQDVGKLLKLSRERVRQIERDAINKLKRQLT